MGDTPYEIVGVAGQGFTGTETGRVTDVFVPMAMKNPRTLASVANRPDTCAPVGHALACPRYNILCEPLRKPAWRS
jgi:hypothetical protein